MSKFGLSGWTDWLHSDDTQATQPTRSHETTFTDSVKGYGFALPGEAPVADSAWSSPEEVLDDGEVMQRETSLLGHAAGWTMFDNLYIYNGSFYVVT